jgi:lysophospholipase L1-like esterase
MLIVALGDSTTAGTPGWTSPLEHPPDGTGDEASQYAYWLMARRPDWQVLNRGVNGERSDQIRARMERDVIEPSPHAVVIIAGVNDIYQGRDARHVIGELRAMYRRALDAGLVVVAGTIVPYNTATPLQNARMREVNGWMTSEAAGAGIAVADTRAAVADPENPDRLAETPDGLHPSVAGYRRMADALAPVLERLLAARYP